MRPVAAAEMLREEVRRVLLPANFAELDAPISHALLHPQAVGVDVPQLAEALARADAHRRRAVGPHAQRRCDTEVFEEALVAEAYSGAFDDAVVFGLTRRQGHECLG